MSTYSSDMLRQHVEELGAIIASLQVVASDDDHSQLEEVLSPLRQAHRELEALNGSSEV
jgi:hypothetical protein